MSDGPSRSSTATRSWSATRAATSRRRRPTDRPVLVDTRFLSRWVLTVNGQRLNALSVDDLQYFETRFFLVPGTGTVYVDSKLSVIRQRAVGDGFHEELTILNHDDEPIELEVRLEADGDFADLFEVKDALEKKGTYSARVEDGSLVLGYRREKFSARRRDLGLGAGRVDESGLTFTDPLEPHGEWTTYLDVVTAMLGAGGPTSGRRSRAAARACRAEHGSAASRSGSQTRRG